MGTPTFHEIELLRPRGSCGYADLVIAHATYGAEGRDALAALLGYQRRMEAVRPQDGDARSEPVSPEKQAFEDLKRRAATKTPFWRLEEREFLKGIEARARPSRRAVSTDSLSDTQPPIHELSPWKALSPRLRAAVTECVQGKTPDIESIIRHFGTGRALRRLPRLPRRRWGFGVQIIVDRSNRLAPFQDDQDLVAVRLAKLFPKQAVEFALFLDGLEEPVILGPRQTVREYRVPSSGALVVVLGDLGCLAGDPGPIVRVWKALGQRLASAGCRVAALNPSPQSRWPLGQLAPWVMLQWERCAKDAARPPADIVERAQRLLRALSPAIRIEPGLLRAVRLLLGEGAADAGTEADVWRSMSGRSRVAATLDTKTANRLRKEFAAEDKTLRIEVMERVQQWRAGLPKEIWFEELLSLDAETQAELSEHGLGADLEAARQFLKNLAPDLERHLGGRAWYRRLYERVSPTYHQQRGDPELRAAQYQLFEAAYRGTSLSPTPPPGFNLALVPHGSVAPRHIEVRQRGGYVVAALAEDNPEEVPGSLLGHIDSRNGIQVIPEQFWASGVPPPWAEAWDTDEHGHWVTFSVKTEGGGDLTKRLRWIPAGRFLMGSPETEAERFGDEGPRHEVTISEGFWLFDTACTQALWQAVMGGNPSRFKGPDRPVEQVSWGDVQGFLAKINQLVPGLGLMLPSEAQWEYACRAGTETPFSFGETITPEQVNYNGNYPYADGKKGLYRQETIPVASLPANSWGLYEMHGNIWEWCADGRRSYTTDAVTDPMGPTDAGADRVLRGGSWSRNAQNVRSASRGAPHPGYRSSHHGFRCARVQEGAEPARARQVRQAKRRTALDWASGAGTWLRLDSGRREESCELPRTPSFVIVSDCERLTFRQITCPPWASSISRDRFGLYAKFEISSDRDVAPLHNPVTQRLRWIPPGRFLMGSPEPEAERFDDEGPRHEVTISDGFWLFDTACTQALWQAVMGDNPSLFKSPDRPVEKVSWEDVQGFLAKINQLVPGLDLMLPSEAQWEYACRAGTETATYTGDLQILGLRNAPALDPIAWYGGNSGVDFDLDKGDDSSGWPEKQYPHTQAGTRPVGLKRPNAWGLYDILGNVWEWCADGRRSYTTYAMTDPMGSTVAGALRVLRGGSWSGSARDVRSACRGALRPGNRVNSSGFRCARVQEGRELTPGPEAQAKKKRRGRSKPPEAAA